MRPRCVRRPRDAAQVRARHGVPSDDGTACALLLGAILLDTANLRPERKAQEAWEADTARALGAAALGPLGPLQLPAWADGGADAWFDELIRAKSDLSMLLQFPLHDLLRQDYKGEAVRCGAVGVASAVVPAAALLGAHGAAGMARAMADFAASRGLRLLLLMCCDFGRGQRQVGHAPPARPRRDLGATSADISRHRGGRISVNTAAQLLAYAADAPLLDALESHLQGGGLDLAPLGPKSAESGAWGAWEQRNYAASRKVVLPLLRDLPPP